MYSLCQKCSQSDDADVEVAIGSGHVGGPRRVVLVPLSPGTPRSVQDRTAASSGSRFAVLESDEEAIPVASVGLHDLNDTASNGGEVESDSDTEESDTESAHTLVQQEEEDRVLLVADVEVPEARMTRAIQEALVSLDTVDMCHMFSVRAVVMKSPPKFLRGAYRAALRIALREICEGASMGDEAKQIRGWKLLLLLPRMELFRPPRGGLIPRQRLFDRFTLFNRGDWIQLLKTGHLDPGAPQWMGRLWRQPERGKKDDTQSCRADLRDRVLWCWRARLEAGGQKKHAISCATWRRPKLAGNLSPSNEERRLRGS